MSPNAEEPTSINSQNPAPAGDDRAHRFTTVGEIDSSVERLWAIVGDFAGLMKWHPKVVSCEVEGSGVGARRTVDLSGRTVVERLDEHDDRNHVIAYSVVEGRPAGTGVSGRIALRALGDTASEVTWVTSVPVRPGSADLVAELTGYYKTRIEHLRKAAARSE